jgi:hypothetical protein
MMKFVMFSAAAANFALGNLIVGTVCLTGGCALSLYESFVADDEPAPGTGGRP